MEKQINNIEINTNKYSTRAQIGWQGGERGRVGYNATLNPEPLMQSRML